MTQTMIKTAIVTGGSRGIGAAISRRLAADGCAVVINYVGNAKAAGDLVKTIEKTGGRALAVQGDVSDPAAMRALFDAAEHNFGGVDVVVTSAGIMPTAPIGEATDEDFDRLVAVNLKGTFNALREAAKRMRDGGRMIAFSTTVVATKLETYGLYTATKAAVEALTGILAKEMRGRNIAVNAVAPGPVGTDLLAGRSPEMLAMFAKAAPMERLGTPDDIAGLVSFLAGPEGGWVNGQTIRANGGLA